jgi:hypothetical protein
MRVTDDSASLVDLSRSSVVVGLSVREETELYDEVGIGRLNKQRTELIMVRTCKFLTFNWMVKGSFALRVSKFFGLTNLPLGSFALGMMRPIGTTLQEPSRTCFPSVKGTFWVKQKLMKLFVEVNEGTWPATGTCCPSRARLGWMTRGSRVNDS